MMTKTERSVFDCHRCGKTAESDNTPVTVGGWHGDIRYGWGRYAGVHMCRAVEARCPDCKESWSTMPDWD